MALCVRLKVRRTETRRRRRPCGNPTPEKEKVGVSGLFWESRCAGGHKTLPPTLLFPCSLTRVADPVNTWWNHAFEGLRGVWSTKRAPTPELAFSRLPCTVRCAAWDGTFDVSAAGDKGAQRSTVRTLPSAFFVAAGELAFVGAFTLALTDVPLKQQFTFIAEGVSPVHVRLPFCRFPLLASHV